MPMLKPLSAAAFAMTVILATPALAAPAQAFECPATEAEARALLSQLQEVGDGVVDEYGFHTRTFKPDGYTVIGLPVTRLELIVNSDVRSDFAAFQAKTSQPFETARNSMFAATGRKACDNTGENLARLCKVYEPIVGNVAVTRYVEVSVAGDINVGCQYERSKG